MQGKDAYAVTSIANCSMQYAGDHMHPVPISAPKANDSLHNESADEFRSFRHGEFFIKECT